ncbi:MAG: hypothetical protein K8J31_09105 [Anaerolineae bacterium]|nr:hypothetical protein [Anaerolineae bacterium]
MTGYCKHCHTTHAVWNRLNDGVICGLCGARERDPRVVPVNAANEARPAHRVAVSLVRAGRSSY